MLHTCIGFQCTQIATNHPRIKNKSSLWHDEISTYLLKETIDIVIKPITNIVNKSFDAGIEP